MALGDNFGQIYFVSSTKFMLIVLLFAFNILQAHSAEDDNVESVVPLSTEECTSIGFNKENLICSSCDMLLKYDLQELRENCFRCCNVVDIEEDKQVVKKFAKAKLEVCWCKFPTMPQIEAFVKSDRPKKFPNLTIKHVDGQSPIIKLIDDNGMIIQTLSITKWDTDTIEEFLQTYLV